MARTTKDKSIAIRITEELYDKLAAAADRELLTVSDLVRRSILQYVAAVEATQKPKR